MVWSRPVGSCVVVAGPTASGKTSLAVRIANALKNLAPEIINIDSVQLYEGCIVGAATPREEERGGIPHHLFGIVPPREPFDVARYLARATTVMDEVRGRGNLPLFVGGTSLYISVLLGGLAHLPPQSQFLRERFSKLTTGELYDELASLDLSSAEALSPLDRVRIERALEVRHLLSPEEISSRYAEHAVREPLNHALIVVPVWPRDVLYDRIAARSARMVEEGLLEETHHLQKSYGEGSAALRSIGYAQAVKVLNGGLPRERLVEEIALATKRFAKRQMTWLRNEPGKRGWRVRPTSEDAHCFLPEDLSRFAKPKRIKSFATLDWDWGLLIEEIARKPLTTLSDSEIWFVPGDRLG